MGKPHIYYKHIFSQSELSDCYMEASSQIQNLLCVCYCCIRVAAFYYLI